MNKKKLLSICVPTYNRAENVSSLLDFLFKEYESLPHEWKEKIEILIRDNCSTDDTECRITDYLSSRSFATYHRNEVNVGAANNFLLLTQEAKGEYIWWLADDDELKEGVVGKILDSLHTYKPAMLFINHSGRMKKDTPVLFSSSVDGTKPDFYEDGRQAVADIIGFGKIGNMLFMSAKVVRRDLLLDACSDIKLPDGSLPLYVGFFAASKGSVSIIKDPMIENIYGEICWQDRAALIHYEQIPATINKLGKLGYSSKQIKVIKNRYFSKNMKKEITLYKIEKNFPSFKSVRKVLRCVKHWLDKLHNKGNL